MRTDRRKKGLQDASKEGQNGLKTNFFKKIRKNFTGLI